MQNRLFFVVLSCVTLAGSACSSVVVLEDDPGIGGAGAGGASPSGTTVGPGPTSGGPTSVATTGVTSGTPVSCDQLTLAYETAIQHARACSRLEPVVQCDGSVILLDECACPTIIANEHNVAEIQAASQAYDAWVAAGCGPYQCEACFPVEGGGFCEALGDGSKGFCTAHE